LNKLIEATYTAVRGFDSISLESFWNEKSDECFFMMSDGKQVPESIITSVKCYCSEANLLVLFKGHYDTLNMVGTVEEINLFEKTEKLWEKSDVFEFFIGLHPKVTGEYFELMIAPDGRWLSARINNVDNKIDADYSWESVVESAVFIDEENKIWYAGFKLALTSICDSAEVSPTYKCNFYRASGKFHGDELLAWSPTGTGANCFHRPEKFGTIVLKNITE